jgi:hypothetical protein
LRLRLHLLALWLHLLALRLHLLALWLHLLPLRLRLLTLRLHLLRLHFLATALFLALRLGLLLRLLPFAGPFAVLLLLVVIVRAMALAILRRSRDRDRGGKGEGWNQGAELHKGGLLLPTPVKGNRGATSDITKQA